MNESEKLIKEKYAKQGYNFLKDGSPDFIFFREDENGIVITKSIFFCEVKGLGDSIKLNQYKYMEILKSLGLNVKVELVEIKNTYTSNHYSDELAQQIYSEIKQMKTKRYTTGTMASEIQKKFGVSRASFYRYLSKFNSKESLIQNDKK